MIASLSGVVRFKTPSSVVLDVHGVGYEVAISSRTYDSLPPVGEEGSLHVFTSVREDAIVLFGFELMEEKELFLLLVSVSGIGPKLGLGILSGIDGKELRDAIMLKDYSRLTALPGVGKKTAQRLCMELAEKIGALDMGSSGVQPVPGSQDKGESAVMQDVISALVNLGYPQNTAWQALRQVYKGADPKDNALSVEQLLKLSLQRLAQ